MEAVEDVKKLKFENLKQMALESMEEFVESQSRQYNDENFDANKLGERYIDCDFYLENLDNVLGIGPKGDSLKLVFNKKKGSRCFNFILKFFKTRTKKKILKTVEVSLLFTMFLTPLFVSNTS